MISIPTLTALIVPVGVVATHRACRCFPGHECWPSESVWRDFNTTLNGKLVATIPLAAPCHKSSFAKYNATECGILQNGWTLPQTQHVPQESLNLAFYAVDIGGAKDVRAALKFAEHHNIRIVLRNSGHDYNGKSTGAGSLGIWTHHLKIIEIFDYKDSHYHGKAMKMGAGVQGFEAYAAAHQRNLTVVGGECPAVGLQAATHKQHRPLLGLSGGGGGTYGVVLSMTVKAHPDMPTSGGNLTYTSEGFAQEDFWSTIETYHQVLPSLVDEGIMSISYFSNSSFSISPMTGPGVSAARMNELLQPFTTKLDALGINYTKFIQQFPDYFEAFYTMFAVTIEVGVAQYGGRLVSRSAVLQNSSALTSAYRSIVDNGGGITIVGLNVSKAVAGDVYNAVNPVWRETLLDTVITTPWNFSAPWSEMQANADKMTEVFIPALEAVTPGGGTYLNEADFQDPNWKENYYGVNYDRLLEIKKMYDPDHVFYALTAVDGDYWEPQVDGRLCKSSD